MPGPRRAGSGIEAGRYRAGMEACAPLRGQHSWARGRAVCFPFEYAARVARRIPVSPRTIACGFRRQGR
ncbi:hypothetical protein BN940_03536 [Castellaniella defragrans 65Phen]|uniref:Uncharacterized protein n=1 Tax=Castellaniella defragrans (strain DSM 12143 / CCUG 39792 / 65Phen) TaxID=1437824 RepID=W8X1Q3_CASD6|nr:hypothetical protein BN940_03536 [Castellaniella defragrans 65Phen]